MQSNHSATPVHISTAKFTHTDTSKDCCKLESLSLWLTLSWPSPWLSLLLPWGGADPAGGRAEAEAVAGTRLGWDCPSSKEVRMLRVEGFLASLAAEWGARRVGLPASTWPSCEFQHLTRKKFLLANLSNACSRNKITMHKIFSLYHIKTQISPSKVSKT